MFKLFVQLTLHIFALTVFTGTACLLDAMLGTIALQLVEATINAVGHCEGLVQGFSTRCIHASRVEDEHHRYTVDMLETCV